MFVTTKLIYRLQDAKLNFILFIMLLRYVALISYILLLSQPGFGISPPTAPVLSLSEAVERSLHQNASFGETKEKENQAEQAIPVARSFLYPNLTALAIAGKQKDAANYITPRNNGDPYNQYSATLRLSQLLFQMGSISAIDSVKKTREIARYNTEIAKRNLTNNIIQAYYLITLNLRNIQTLLEQQKIVSSSLKVARQRNHTGRGQLLDILQVQTQLALLEGQIATTKNQLNESRTILASLLGSSQNQEFTIKDGLEAPTIAEAESTIDRENIRIPEILKDELLLQQIDDQRKTLWGQNLPYLNLLGTYGFTSYRESELFIEPANSWTVQLQLTIPLFSGLSTVYQNRELISQQMQLQLDRRYVEDQVNLQQINNKKNLETALDSIETGKKALKFSQESLKEAKHNYSLATIDYVQYLAVQQQYIQSQQSLNAYKYNYITALGNYYAATGQDMSRLVALLEKALPN